MPRLTSFLTRLPNNKNQTSRQQLGVQKELHRPMNPWTAQLGFPRLRRGVINALETDAWDDRTSPAPLDKS
jgi:hypothetical protein